MIFKVGLILKALTSPAEAAIVGGAGLLAGTGFIKGGDLFLRVLIFKQRNTTIFQFL